MYIYTYIPVYIYVYCEAEKCNEILAFPSDIKCEQM